MGVEERKLAKAEEVFSRARAANERRLRREEKSTEGVGSRTEWLVFVLVFVAGVEVAATAAAATGVAVRDEGDSLVVVLELGEVVVVAEEVLPVVAVVTVVGGPTEAAGVERDEAVEEEVGGRGGSTTAGEVGANEAAADAKTA